MGEELTVAEHVGKNVHDLRQALGLTQGELAKAMSGIGLGWHRGTVADVESGARELTVSELVALATFFELPIWTLATQLSLRADDRDVVLGDRRLSWQQWTQLWHERRDLKKGRDHERRASPEICKAIDQVVGHLDRPWAGIWRDQGGHAAPAYQQAWEEIVATRPAIGPTITPMTEPIGVSGIRGPWGQAFSFEIDYGEPYAARDDVEREHVERLIDKEMARRITPQQAYKLRNPKGRGN
jgi:transcriptional regulator with XRE-family HTH domain